jgi:mannose-6-phosphate isomerase-like protein (cupin superfamily)
MNMIDIFEDHADEIAEKIPYHGKIPQELLKDYTWDIHMEMLDTHPQDLLDTNSSKMRIGLNSFHTRGSAPQFAKDIEAAMQEVFALHGNKITNIAFTGFGPNSDSYPRHADKMDVFLVQVLGNIRICVDGLHDEPVDFLPGDYYWIPRGNHHQVFPERTRSTFSFGVEGNPDPSIYF